MKFPVRIGVVSAADGSPWVGLQEWLQAKGFDLVPRFFPSYLKQTEALLDGGIDIAWNGPWAHVQLEALTKGESVSLGMRDSDRDVESLLLCNQKPSPATTTPPVISTLVAGAGDSPQAYILPVMHLKDHGLDTRKVDLIRYELEVGKHGEDNGAAEREVMSHLLGRSSNELLFGTVSRREYNQFAYKQDLHVAQTFFPFDSHQLDCLPSLAIDTRLEFQTLLQSMRPDTSWCAVLWT
ncbi:hypothetical protein BASA81_007732 [Batrachochytrium salamandrivorans]|nr:hypothetical protein BASA81_007732 [Batrachochytrium salamandrivorans]